MKRSSADKASHDAIINGVVSYISGDGVVFRDADAKYEQPKKRFATIGLQTFRSVQDAEVLFNQHMGLAYNFHKKFCKMYNKRCGLERDDILQIVFKMMWMACLTWDGESAKFSTWSFAYIKSVNNDITRYYIKPCNTDRGLISIDSVIQYYQDSTLLDTSDSVLDKLEFIDNVEKLRTLSVRKAKIMVDRLIYNKTLKECGDELGITRERVRQIEGKCLEQLLGVNDFIYDLRPARGKIRTYS